MLLKLVYASSNFSNSSGSAKYRWGFQGQEKDDEMKGAGNSYTAEFWQYDSRLGRRWNRDPINYPWQSSYATFNNNPVFFVDPSGLEGVNPQEDAKGEKGSVAPNGGIRTGENSIIGGQNLCLGCGENGEDIYGLPGGEGERIGGTIEVKDEPISTQSEVDILSTEHISQPGDETYMMADGSHKKYSAIGISLYGIAEGATGTIEDYNKVIQALNENKFLSRALNKQRLLKEYQIDPVTGKAKFTGNGSVTGEDINSALRKFKFKAGTLKVLKAGGVITNSAGILLTLHEIDESGYTMRKGTDLIAGFVGFVPGYGWILAGGYFVTMTVVDGTTHYMIQHGPPIPSDITTLQKGFSMFE